VPGRVLVDNLAAALPDHAQHGAALGRPAAGDAQQQAGRPESAISSSTPVTGRSAGPWRPDRRGSSPR
jgi:hypothetical protein